MLAALFGLLFLAYMTNADMKLIEKLYDALIKYHDAKPWKKKSDISRAQSPFSRESKTGFVPILLVLSFALSDTVSLNNFV